MDEFAGPACANSEGRRSWDGAGAGMPRDKRWGVVGRRESLGRGQDPSSWRKQSVVRAWGKVDPLIRRLVVGVIVSLSLCSLLNSRRVSHSSSFKFHRVLPHGSDRDYDRMRPRRGQYFKGNQ